MTDWKIGDLVRLTRDADKAYPVALSEGTLGAWGWITEKNERNTMTVRLAGASRPFGSQSTSLYNAETKHVVPFVRQAQDEPTIAAVVLELLTRLSWTLPGDVVRQGDTITVARDRTRPQAYFVMNSLVDAEVAPYLGEDLRPNADAHALLDRANVGRTMPFSIVNQAYEAWHDRTGFVSLRDVGLDRTHVIEGETAAELVTAERTQPRFTSDGKLDSALLEALPLPRTMRLDRKYSNVLVKVVDVDGDAIQVHRDDEVSTFVGKDAKKIRRAAEKVFDIARWTKEKLPSLTPVESPAAPTP